MSCAFIPAATTSCTWSGSCRALRISADSPTRSRRRGAASPRTAVPAGTVGIGGQQTGVYPLESPGGWNLIGRTPLRDLRHHARRAIAARHGRSRALPPDLARRIRRLAAARDAHASSPPGCRRPCRISDVSAISATAFPPAARWIVVACASANLLVGNDERAAALETTLIGPAITLRAGNAHRTRRRRSRARRSMEHRSPTGIRCWSRADATLRFGQPTTAVVRTSPSPAASMCRCVFGSRSTYLRGGFGGFDGRALRAGDTLRTLGCASAHVERIAAIAARNRRAPSSRDGASAARCGRTYADRRRACASSAGAHTDAAHRRRRATTLLGASLSRVVELGSNGLSSRGQGARAREPDGAAVRGRHLRHRATAAGRRADRADGRSRRRRAAIRASARWRASICRSSRSSSPATGSAFVSSRSTKHSGCTLRRKHELAQARAGIALRIHIRRRTIMTDRVDLNCDMGESFGAYRIGADDAVFPFITSANVACGFHGGDPAVMRTTLAQRATRRRRRRRASGLPGSHRLRPAQHGRDAGRGVRSRRLSGRRAARLRAGGEDASCST